jgi:transposase-like protein
MTALYKIATHGIKYICHDCNFIFAIFRGLGTGRKPVCPSCGENWGVNRFQQPEPTKGEKRTLITWTDEEEEMLEQCLDGKVSVTQMAIMLGRTRNSVAKKLGRMRGNI